MTAEILPQEDAEISQLARKAFEKQGIRVLTQCAVTASSPTATGVKVTLEQQGKRSELEVERVIVAAGIVGNVENLGLEGTRVKVEKSHIVTDGLCRTGEPGVYAIGDVAGAPGWRTRPAMKVCCAWRPSPASRRTPSTRCAFPPAPTRTRKWPASA